jgi:hypothetical protein
MTLLATPLAVALLGESLLQLLAFTVLVSITAMTALFEFEPLPPPSPVFWFDNDTSSCFGCWTGPVLTLASR